MASTKRKIRSTIEHHNWSNLPTDLLESISTNLSFTDFLSFKGVCSSWRNATKVISIPRFVFFSKSQCKIDAKVLFFDIKNKTINFQKETPLCLKQRGIHCDEDIVIGSHSDGWLFLFDKKGYYFLIELLTHVRIDLPKNIKCKTSSESEDSWQHKAIVSDNPNCRQDFIVIMLYGTEGNKKLAFWKNGDSRWSRVQGDESESYSDIVWCNDTLYALKPHHDPLSVEIWDFKRNGISSGSPTKKFSVIESWSHHSKLGMDMSKLVVSSRGEVLVTTYYQKRKEWAVYKVDLIEEQCVQLKTLNGQALVMVGIESKPSRRDSRPSDPLVNNNLFCISSADVENYGYKPNSIYLAGGESWNTDTCYRKIRLSNYSMEHEDVEELWVSIVPFDMDVKLQPLGLFSVNAKSCIHVLEPAVTVRRSKRCKY